MTGNQLKLIPIILISFGLWACSLPVMRTGTVPESVIPLNEGTTAVPFLTNFERQVIVELNEARTNPLRYAEFLKGLRGSPQWSEGLDNAITLVETKEPLPPLRASRGLSLAARELLDDRGPEGLTGHRGKDGKSVLERMNAYGTVKGKFGEYLGYGYREGAALVSQMVIDEAGTGKEGQKYVFDRDLLVVGVACGPHRTYRTMCVVDFVQAYSENERGQPSNK